MKREEKINSYVEKFLHHFEEKYVFGRPQKDKREVLKALLEKVSYGLTLRQLESKYGIPNSTLCRYQKKWTKEGKFEMIYAEIKKNEGENFEEKKEEGH